MPRSTSRNHNRRGEPFWASFSDDQLLDLRFRDLDLPIESTELMPAILRLYRELEARSLSLRPPCWLSSEWFSPFGAPGIAIPFYLAHPRLRKLEHRQMGEVEGGTRTWLMQLLRHEAGHAYEVAYRLNRKNNWHKIFGRSTKRYPTFYRPKPLSRNFVLHLDWWYAQSHPVEDFAETFAVWLQPSSGWRTRYKDWPALKKLEYVDEIMAGIAGQPSPLKPGHPVEPLQHLRQTLRQHYRKKWQLYQTDNAAYYDRDLRRLFPPFPDNGKYPPAAAFLRRIGSKIPLRVASWKSQHAYTSHLVLKEMLQRSRELGLRLSRPESELEEAAVRLLIKQTVHYLYNKRYRLAM